MGFSASTQLQRHHTLPVVDAFTACPFAGNPAAVCVLNEPADEVWMQLVAREMNLSETAFLHPVADGYELLGGQAVTMGKLELFHSTMTRQFAPGSGAGKGISQ